MYTPAVKALTLVLQHCSPACFCPNTRALMYTSRHVYTHSGRRKTVGYNQSAFEQSSHRNDIIKHVCIIRHANIQPTILSDAFLCTLHSHSPDLQIVNRLVRAGARGLLKFMCMIAVAPLITHADKKNWYYIK